MTQHPHFVGLKIEGKVLPDPSIGIKKLKGITPLRTDKARIIYMAEMRDGKAVPVDFIKNAGAETWVKLQNIKLKGFDYEIGKVLQADMNWTNGKGIYFFNTADEAMRYHLYTVMRLHGINPELHGIDPNKEKEKRNETGNQ